MLNSLLRMRGDGQLFFEGEENDTETARDGIREASFSAPFGPSSAGAGGAVPRPAVYFAALPGASRTRRGVHRNRVLRSFNCRLDRMPETTTT